MSNLDGLLSRLQGVRGRNGNFTARCPAHDDKRPSLAVKEEGGKIVMHCFAGCSVQSIIESVGMDMTDLFPERDSEYQPQKRTKFFATDLLRVIGFEATLVAIAARSLANGKPLPQADIDRLMLACSRINEAVELSC